VLTEDLHPRWEARDLLLVLEVLMTGARGLPPTYHDLKSSDNNSSYNCKNRTAGAEFQGSSFQMEPGTLRVLTPNLFQSVSRLVLRLLVSQFHSALPFCCSNNWLESHFQKECFTLSVLSS
jgi:hypothetical protein